MALIKPMALIESMRKKVCMHSDVYFRTNKQTGKTYTGKLNQSSGSYKVGKTITVLYDPNDPSAVHGDGTFGIIFIAVGAVILAVIIFTTVKEKQGQRTASTCGSI